MRRYRYTIKESDRKEIGTDIILHINDDNKDFLKDTKIKELVKKYTNFLPVEIQVNGTKENDENPLWVKAPADTKEEEYKEWSLSKNVSNEPRTIILDSFKCRLSIQLKRYLILS